MTERMDYVTLLGGWLLYFILHKLLTSEMTKRYLANALGDKYFYYKLGFTSFFILGLFVLLIVNAAASVHADFFASRPVTRYISLAFTAFGVIIIRLAFKEYATSDYLEPLERREKPFITSGIFSKIRHPFFAGLIIISIGFFMFSPSIATLISCATIICYLFINIFFQEKTLLKKYKDYEAYRSSAGMLIPKLFRSV